MAESMTKAVWPGWETVRVIGRGSFATVYEIRREVFGHWEKAALKLIRIPQNESEIEALISEGYDERSITSRFEGYLQDIVREYSMMADMKGCANIVYCDDVRYIQHDDGVGWDIYIKMELLTPLTKTLEKSVTDSRVVRIGMDLCSALAFCERRNVLHRDIKPQNIFVAPDGTCKLGDFGVAKTAERTTSGTRTGTYKFMAPEVYNNQPYGTKADIYSLGLVLYCLLNERRTPFLPLPPAMPTAGDEDLAQARRFRGEPIPAPAHGSPELRRIVLKACAFDPAERYQCAEDMLRDLSALGLAPAGTLLREQPVTERPGEGSAAVKDPPLAPAGETPGRPAADIPPAAGEAIQTGEVNPERAPKSGKKGLLFGVIGGAAALALILLIVLMLKAGADGASAVLDTWGAYSDDEETADQATGEEETAEEESAEEETPIWVGTDFCKVQIPDSWAEKSYIQREDEDRFSVRYSGSERNGGLLFFIQAPRVIPDELSDGDFLPRLEQTPEDGEVYSLWVRCSDGSVIRAGYPAGSGGEHDRGDGYQRMLRRSPELVKTAQPVYSPLEGREGWQYAELASSDGKTVTALVWSKLCGAAWSQYYDGERSDVWLKQYPSEYSKVRQITALYTGSGYDSFVREKAEAYRAKHGANEGMTDAEMTLREHAEQSYALMKSELVWLGGAPVYEESVQYINGRWWHVYSGYNTGSKAEDRYRVFFLLDEEQRIAAELSYEYVLNAGAPGSDAEFFREWLSNLTESLTISG